MAGRIDMKWRNRVGLSVTYYMWQTGQTCSSHITRHMCRLDRLHRQGRALHTWPDDQGRHGGGGGRGLGAGGGRRRGGLGVGGGGVEEEEGGGASTDLCQLARGGSGRSYV